MLCCLMICTITIDARTVNDIYKRISAQVSLKVPGNQSRNYSLAFQGAVDDKGIYLLESEEKIPLIITESIYYVMHLSALCGRRMLCPALPAGTERYPAHVRRCGRLRFECEASAW